MTNPPLYACYLLFSNSGVPVWLPTGDPSAGSAGCNLGTAAGAPNLRVVVGPAAAGQGFAVVVVY